MKKNISILLISLLAISILVCNVYYISSLIIAKQEFKHSSKYETIYISLAAAKKIHNHEIVLDNVMYDIASSSQINDIIELKVYKDTRETELLSFMNGIKTSNADISLLNFLSLISNDQIHPIDLCIEHISIDTHIGFNTILQEKIVLSNMVPPPECFAE
ncbi:MAG: hypothetical protein WCP57_11895 [Bacteroidota bacterium]